MPKSLFDGAGPSWRVSGSSASRVTAASAKNSLKIGYPAESSTQSTQRSRSQPTHSKTPKSNEGIEHQNNSTNIYLFLKINLAYPVVYALL